MNADAIVQFLLVDHLAATGWAVLLTCILLKVWMLKTSPGHPHYLGKDPEPPAGRPPMVMPGDRVTYGSVTEPEWVPGPQTAAAHNEHSWNITGVWRDGRCIWGGLGIIRSPEMVVGPRESQP